MSQDRFYERRGKTLQKRKPVAVEQRFVPCQVPLSPLIYFLTVLLALWAFIPFAMLVETGKKHGELITESGFVLKEATAGQAQQRMVLCCSCCEVSVFFGKNI